MTTQIRSKAINPSTECNTVSPYAALLIGSSPPRRPSVACVIDAVECWETRVQARSKGVLKYGSQVDSPPSCGDTAAFAPATNSNHCPLQLSFYGRTPQWQMRTALLALIDVSCCVCVWGGGGVRKRKHGPNLASEKYQRIALGVDERIIILWSKQSCHCA
jgi:hypothetical protein